MIVTSQPGDAVSSSPKRRRVSLFIPCLVEDFFPEIGEAAAVVLDRAGVAVDYPEAQTCCGQLAYKTGHRSETRRFARHFLETFARAEAVVSPSGSCVSMVKNYYPSLLADDSTWAQAAEDMAGRVFELSQYLVDVLGLKDLGASWPGRAVYHDSCQVSRALGVSEQPQALLRAVAGLELRELDGADTCCGFGGAFSLQFPEVSERLLDDKVAAIEASGAEMVVSAEVSCLMNIGGRLAKTGSPVKALHLAQVLAGKEARS